MNGNYNFYRLRTSDGLLDLDLNNTWNVVAVPKIGVWSSVNLTGLFENPDKI